MLLFSGTSRSDKFKGTVSLRKLAASASDVQHKAVKTGENYMKLFVEHQGIDVMSYNESQRLGNGISEVADTNWMTEAQRTGEIFPVRSVVRPGIDFGPSLRAENSKNCQKSTRSH